MTLLSSARNRWLLLAALWVVLLVLGIGGFLQQSSDGDLHRTFLDNLYLTLQLAALDYGGGDDALNWRLQVARFAAPVMAASTVLLTASLVFVEQFRQFRLRFVSDHTIVCGLGDIGTRIAQAFAATGAQVVAVESDPVAEGVAAARAANITVVVGDATDPATLQTARIGRAARLICVCGDDAGNLQISIAAADLPRAGTNALRCAVHLAGRRSGWVPAQRRPRCVEADPSHVLQRSRASRPHTGWREPALHRRRHDESRCRDGARSARTQPGRRFGAGMGRSPRRRTASQSPWSTASPRDGGRRCACSTPPCATSSPPRCSISISGAPRADEVDRLRAAVAERQPTWVCMAFEDESLGALDGAPCAARTGHRRRRRSSSARAPSPVSAR